MKMSMRSVRSRSERIWACAISLRPKPASGRWKRIAGQATEYIAPQTLLRIAMSAKTAGVRAVYFDTVHRADMALIDDILADELRVLPVLFGVAVVVL